MKVQQTVLRWPAKLKYLVIFIIVPKAGYDMDTGQCRKSTNCRKENPEQKF